MKQIILAWMVCVGSLYAVSLDEALESYKQGAYIKALDGFYTLAKEGDKIAQHNLALMYATGKGAKKDEDKAIRWYEKAAKQHFGISAYNLAEIYQKRGLKDAHAFVKAKYWYEKAIDANVTEAYNNLATLYIGGKGVQKDMLRALALFEKSATLQNSIAQVNTGRLYAWGEGLTHDKMKAYENFKKALKAGQSEASADLDRLCKESAWVCKD